VKPVDPPTDTNWLFDCPFSAAAIIDVPFPTAVTSPLELTVATAVSEDVQVAEFVRSWKVPSLKAPNAENCNVFPIASVPVPLLLTRIDSSDADVALVRANITASGCGAAGEVQLVQVV
jgi:hypothetical protein